MNMELLRKTIDFVLKNPIKVGAVIFLSYMGFSFPTRFIKHRRLKSKIASKTKEKRKNEDEIRRQLGELDKNDSKWMVIRSTPIEELLQKLRDDDIKPIDALRAFQIKSLYINKTINCIVEFLTEAQEMALALEKLPKEQRGPLFGLPLSVKETYHIQGHDSSCGMTYNLLNPVQENSTAVQHLINLGAIPFCLTNVPQTTFSFLTSNPCFGETINPFNNDRDVGGSSGGEAALISAGGSILGIGNDIGGSLRNPSAMCGTVSLKPTYGRHLSQIKVTGPGDYVPVYPKIIGGFFADNLTTLAKAWEITYNNPCSTDPEIIPLPWRNKQFADRRRLRIGYYSYDGLIAAHPGNVRAVDEAVELLKQRGHTLLKIDPPPMREVMRLYLGFCFADNGELVMNAVNKDLPDPSMAWLKILRPALVLPRFAFRSLKNILQNFTNFQMHEPLDTGKKCMAATVDMMKLTEMYQSYLNKMKCDCLITLGSIFPAPKKRKHGELTSFAVYAYAPWNIMDMPAGIVPVSKISSQDEENFAKMKNRDLVHNLINPAIRDAEGLPLSVQVVARRYEEEIVLKVMKELEEQRNEDLLSLMKQIDFKK